MILAEMTMTQVEQGLKTCKSLLIPFGALEEHGPHLPLATDTLQALEVAIKASKLVPLFVAPPVNYGNCRSTACHPGTISISTATLKGLLKDIVHSCYRQGIFNVIALTGHAGGAHRMALQDAGEELLYELPELQIAVVTEYELAKEAGRGLWKRRMTPMPVRLRPHASCTAIRSWCRGARRKSILSSLPVCWCGTSAVTGPEGSGAIPLRLLPKRDALLKSWW